LTWSFYLDGRTEVPNMEYGDSPRNGTQCEFVEGTVGIWWNVTVAKMCIYNLIIMFLIY